MKVGDRVYKKSRKPFQNGKRVGIIDGFTRLYIKDKGHTILAVVLDSCVGPVAQQILRTDEEGLALMAERDKPKYKVFINGKQVAKVDSPDKVWEVLGQRQFGALYEVGHEDPDVELTEFIPF